MISSKGSNNTYSGITDTKGTLHIHSIDLADDEDLEDIKESLATGHLVMLDCDLERIKVCAGQLGLATTFYESGK